MALDAAFLMYHELQSPGRALCDDAPGYTRYVVSFENFESQMEALMGAGTRGLSVSQALRGERGVVLTFDDGCESDWLLAAPLLKKWGFGATFFVVSDWIGRDGFLWREQVRDLASGDLEIGSHSVSHAFLSDLTDEDLHRELKDSKQILEEIIGQKIAHFSCPGGRFDARVAQFARELSYQTVSTSRVGRNDQKSDLFRLSRMAVTSGTQLRDFERLCRGEVLPREKMRDWVLSGAKTLLGNDFYTKARTKMLKAEGQG